MLEHRLAFGPFVLDSKAGTLVRDGEPVSVSYRGLLLLNAFLSHPGEVLTKSKLLDAAWEGTVVDETNLSVQIAALRASDWLCLDLGSVGRAEWTDIEVRGRRRSQVAPVAALIPGSRPSADGCR